MKKFVSILFLLSFLNSYALNYENYYSLGPDEEGYFYYVENGLLFKIVDPIEKGVYIVNSAEANLEAIFNGNLPDKAYRDFVANDDCPEDLDLTGVLMSGIFYCRVKLLGIGYGAFANCKNLKRLTLPTTIEEIADGAFYGCANLQYVGFLEVDRIGEEAFGGCTSIHTMSFKFNDSVEPHAFSNSSLKVVEFINSTGTLKPESFAGCPNLESVQLYRRVPVMEDAFDESLYTTGKLWTSYSIIEEARTAEGWKRFKNIDSYSQLGIEGVKTGTGIAYDGATVRSAGCEITLYHITGRKVSSSFESLSVEGVAPGVYIAVAGAETKKITVR